MLKKILLCTFLLLSTSFILFAQRGQRANVMANNDNYVKDSTYRQNTKKATIKKPARDFVMLMATYNDWVSKPDSVKTKPFNYGFQAYFCYDFPIKNTNFSFAAGLGVNVSAMYMDQQQILLSDTASVNSQARVVSDSSHFSRYKFVTTYLSAPFELRYFSDNANRNKGFKASIGLQIGTLLGAHTKAVTTVNGSDVAFKVNTKRYISTWNFATTARIGWGNFSIFGSYNLTTVFNENQGPAITPMSIGFCLSGL
jgi:Outer membrane protein beta-barrel domain